MKPKEFDELVRQKFEQNDFEYNPRNWEQLAGELDGRSKKRSLMGLWMPLLGIAATITLAMGILFLMHYRLGGPSIAYNNAGKNIENSKSNLIVTSPYIAEISNGSDAGSKVKGFNNTGKNRKNRNGKQKNDVVYEFQIKLQNALGGGETRRVKVFNFMNERAATGPEKKKQIMDNEVVNTFKPEAEVPKAPKLSVILSGGVNHGNQNSGYMAGATVRRMINKRVYVESDVAFAYSNNSQVTSVAFQNSARLAGRGTGGKDSLQLGVTNVYVAPVVLSQNTSYNVNYVQVSPALGYKLMKKLSVGVGPDFQQMLADNRPVASDNYRGHIQESPLFDIGLIGKTEYSLAKNIKAGVSYRKGINNIITPTATEKFIDRDYLTVQLKWSVFSK